MGATLFPMYKNNMLNIVDKLETGNSHKKIYQCNLTDSEKESLTYFLTQYCPGSAAYNALITGNVSSISVHGPLRKLVQDHVESLFS